MSIWAVLGDISRPFSHTFRPYGLETRFINQIKAGSFFLVVECVQLWLLNQVLFIYALVPEFARNMI